MTSTAQARARLRPAQLPPEMQALLDDRTQREKLRAQVREQLDQTRIHAYQPYPKQLAFHQAGQAFRERLMMAGNQLGKTLSAGAETTFHLTGEYPDWWQGRRFDHPVAFWAAGVTNEATRDTVQRILCGRSESIGTGMVPKAKIKSTTTARGIADCIDTLFVHHTSGGVSQLTFKSYEEKREKWQGETLHGVWCDEEPPEPLYMEALTRTNATNGIIYTTFTPLLGMSKIVRMFYPRPNTPDRFLIQMTIEDALHIDDQQRARIIASYPQHEREARTRGIPQLGSGALFSIPESSYVVPAFTIPAHWPRICGIDLGFAHPFGAAMVAFDRDADCAYVTATHQAKAQTILQHAEVIKGWGAGLPVAWPHDANSHDSQSADTYAELYRKHGLEMLFEHATFATGGFGLEASIADLVDRLESGGLKIFSHLTDLLEEMRGMHRRDGKIVKENDDVLSALRYALMMERFAARLRRRQSHDGPIRRNLRSY